EVFFTDPRSERGDHGADLFVPEHLVVTRFFHVEDLALQRQDRLEAAIATLLRGPTCGFALDQIDLATLCLALRAVSQLTGQTTTVERALAAREFAGLAGRFTGTGRFDRFVDDAARDRRVLLEVRPQALIHECLHDAGDIRIQLALRLPFKLRL